VTAGKKVTFTHHAEDAIREREIDPDWIMRTALDPEWRTPDPYRPGVERRFRSIPEFNNRVLRVACIESDIELRIVTVFFDRHARKQR